MKLYRGIISDNEKQAMKYIKSTNGTGAKDYGVGVYFTSEKETAEYYGNYIFEFDIDPLLLKQVSHDVYIMTKKDFKEYFQNLHCELIQSLDLGINAKYIFTSTTWIKYRKGEEYK